MDLGEAGDLKQFGGTFYYYGMSSAQGWLPTSAALRTDFVSTPRPTL